MDKIHTHVIGLLLALQGRVEDSRNDERGLGTLEMVVIGLGLFLAAGAAILVFTGAIDTRLEKIK